MEALSKPGVHRIVGPTILLGDGSYFDFADPGASTITIEDIAYGLAFACRFAGQCVERATGRRVFYSVAEHCVRMSWACEAVLQQKFQVPMLDRALIKRFDLIMLATEKRDLMPAHGHRWPLLDGLEPLPDPIVPWRPEAAAAAFLQRYVDLRFGARV